MVGLSYKVQLYNANPGDETPYGNAILLAPYKKSLVMPGDTVNNLLVIETAVTPIVRVAYHGPNGCGKATNSNVAKDIPMDDQTLQRQLDGYSCLLENVEGRPTSLAVIDVDGGFQIRDHNDLHLILDMYWNYMLSVRGEEFQRLADMAHKDALGDEYKRRWNRKKEFTYQLVIDGITFHELPNIPASFPPKRVMYIDDTVKDATPTKVEAGVLV